MRAEEEYEILHGLFEIYKDGHLKVFLKDLMLYSPETFEALVEAVESVNKRKPIAALFRDAHTG